MEKKDYMETKSHMGDYLHHVESQFIAKCLQKTEGVHRILDVGGGYGRLAIPLRKKGYQVTVTEVRPLPLHRLKVHAPQSDGILTGDRACDWPVKDAAMDCILAIQVPVVEFDWFWSECRRVLKPDGSVIFTATNHTSFKGLYHKLGDKLRPILLHLGVSQWKFQAYYSMSTSTVIQTFEAEGFQLRHALGYGWLPAGRDSNLSLIPLFARAEQMLNLGKFIFQSPWVIFEVRAI